MKTFLWRWLPVLAWAGVIFFFSGIPNPYRALPPGWNRPPAAIPAASDNELLGRILHTAEYAVLAALTLRALAWQKPALPLHPLPKPAPPRRVRLVTFLAALGLCMLYALSDELHQVFVPGRAFQLLDLGLDLAGALAGAALYFSCFLRGLAP